MKHFYLLTLTALCGIFSHAQSIETTNSTDYTTCNGSATVGIYYTGGIYHKTWYRDSTEIAQGVDSVFNLCPGAYGVVIDTNGVQVDYLQFNIYSDSIVQLMASLTATPDFGSGGTATISVQNGAAPYQYSIAGQSFSGSQATATASGIAPGIYTAWVTHAAYDTVFFQFAIYNDSVAYGQLTQTSYEDTINFDPFENCNLNYAAVDSAWLASAFMSGQNLIVNYAIVSGTDTLTATVTYPFSDTATGYYLVTQVIYCPTKSGTEMIAIKGEIPFENGNPVLSVNETVTATVKAYPNPFTDIITISGDGDISDIQVFDLAGNVLLTKEASANETQLNLEDFSAGTYVLRINAANGSKVIKIVK